MLLLDMGKKRMDCPFTKENRRKKIPDYYFEEKKKFQILSSLCFCTYIIRVDRHQTLKRVLKKRKSILPNTHSAFYPKIYFHDHLN